MITVEFFSIPRRRAGTQQLEVPVQQPIAYRELLAKVAEALPAFGEGCLDENGELEKHYLALVDERRVADPTTLISDRSRVMILSADVGG